LSFAQQRLWFLAQMEGASRAYHIPLGVRMSGELNREALRRALDRIVARHEALRTTFAMADGQPIQRIGPEESGFALEEHELSGPGGAEELERLMAEEALSAFDLEQGPLIRGRLIGLGETEHALLITMHHIVSDGWSMGVLIDELSRLYRAYSEGKPEGLPGLRIQYADYAAWQRRWIAGEVLQSQSEYWQRRLDGAPALMTLPADWPRPSVQDHAGESVGLELDEALTSGLKALSQRQGTTLFMTLLAGWAALLGRLSGQEDVVIGAPVANRTRAEVEPLIGFFVNTLAMRVDLSGSPEVWQLLERVKVETLGAQENQDLPFEQVVEIVKPQRSLAHSPLFQVMFTWQNNEAGELELPGLELAAVGARYETAKFDLALTLFEAGDRIAGGVVYARALFDRSTMDRYSRYYCKLLREMIAGDRQVVDRLQILSQGEREQLLVEWNETRKEYPRRRCVHQLFEAQAARTPHALAMAHEDRKLTYGELDACANRLARHLRGLGVSPGARVPILLDRSIELALAELAILKCGAAYVPLDLNAPPARLAAIIGDCGANLLLTVKELETPSIAGVERVEIDGLELSGESAERVGVEVESEAPAYVIYTSGSTGEPKGVVIPHRAVVRLVINNGYASIEEGDRVAFNSNPAFDASAVEVWGALLNGARVVVIGKEELLEPRALVDVVRREEVNVLHLVAGLMNAYGEQLRPVLGSLRYLLTGGDVVDPRAVREAVSGGIPGRVIHCYGPSESATFATTEEVREVEEGARSIPIGRPISNTRVYVLDGQREPAPVGVEGEIYIGGEGLGHGYLNGPEMTAERFVADPYGGEGGVRMYRTGDLGRYLGDGRIEYLGRNDLQVKIRGMRVEPGEIEAKIGKYAGIRETVVAAREDERGEKRLVAYYTVKKGEGGGGRIEAEALRGYLSTELPEHMVPVAYVELEGLPLTANGKLDRSRLPAPVGEVGVGREYEAPEGEVEETLSRIWSELLKVERVGRRDNFFELGGHSLLGMRLIERMRSEGLDIDVRALFATATLAEMAAVTEKMKEIMV